MKQQIIFLSISLLLGNSLCALQLVDLKPTAAQAPEIQLLESYRVMKSRIFLSDMDYTVCYVESHGGVEYLKNLFDEQGKAIVAPPVTELLIPLMIPDLDIELRTEAPFPFALPYALLHGKKDTDVVTMYYKHPQCMIKLQLTCLHATKCPKFEDALATFWQTRVITISDTTKPGERLQNTRKKQDAIVQFSDEENGGRCEIQ